MHLLFNIFPPNTSNCPDGKAAPVSRDIDQLGSRVHYIYKRIANMRVHPKHSALVLLLLPALAASAAIEPKAPDAVLAAKPVVAGAIKDYTAITTSGGARVPTQKPAVGTKDAPVDGLDGKPHAGPFVDTAPVEKKKAAAEGDDLVKPVPTSLAKLKEGGYGASTDGWDSIPEKNDGVMDDVNRVVPKEGTTGTEGGVTERSKKEKATEGQTGEKVEKKPETPKEAPPLPNSEETVIKDTLDKSKDKTIQLSGGKLKGAQGLEVCFPSSGHASQSF